MINEDLPVSININAMLDARNAILTKVDQIRQLKEEINDLSTIHAGRDYLLTDIEREHFDPDRCKQKVDYQFWTHALNTLNITNVMTESAKQDYLREIEKHTPEFCQTEIDILHANATRIYGESIDQTIREVYNHLIGCFYNGAGWQRKKDNLQKVEQTFRIHGNINYDGWCHGFRFHNYSYSRSFNYEDFLTACYLLDGRGQVPYDKRFYALADKQLKECNKVDTEYFNVRCYKNGNQLITWKQDKIYVLERLNQVGSGNCSLPDVMRKRYKKEHFAKNL